MTMTAIVSKHRILARAKRQEGAKITMHDLFFIVLSVIFFAVSAAFVRGCEKLENEEK